MSVYSCSLYQNVLTEETKRKYEWQISCTEFRKQIYNLYVLQLAQLQTPTHFVNKAFPPN